MLHLNFIIHSGPPFRDCESIWNYVGIITYLGNGGNEKNISSCYLIQTVLYGLQEEEVEWQIKVTRGIGETKFQKQKQMKRWR